MSWFISIYEHVLQNMFCGFIWLQELEDKSKW